MDLYVIGYDITNPKRLVRMHRLLQKFAMPIQYSIFLFWGPQTHLDRCMALAKGLMNDKEDALCCYRLPLRGQKINLGAAGLPDGIFLAPADFCLT